MKRLLLGVACVILLGGCGSVPSSQEPLHIPKDSPTTSVIPQIVERQVNWSPREPRRLRLLGTLDAPVIPLELQGDALVPPADPQVLGWWGQQAGSKKGATLLVGHTVRPANWKVYGHGELDNLEEVALGTDVNVSGVHYTVTSNKVISKASLARRAPHLFSQTGSHRLVVVTCEDYDPLTGHYSSNVVLVAK